MLSRILKAKLEAREVRVFRVSRVLNLISEMERVDKSSRLKFSRRIILAKNSGVPVADLDEILSVGEAYGDVFKADSLAALAEQLGLEKLTENVEDQGGAYYAIKGASYVYSTCGGVEVDASLNVVDVDGKPVQGLYAVGNDSLGVLLASEKAYVTYGGAAAGWALTSGRLAGAYAAAFAKGE